MNEILILRIEIAVKSMNVSSGRYIAYAMADSEREEESGATIFFGTYLEGLTYLMKSV